MDMNNIDVEAASIIFNKIDVSDITNLINAETLSDVSNLGLNEDEIVAYNNIMSSRKVEKHLEGSMIGFNINYDSVNDPGDYLSVLLEGQEAPEITGTVHLPQGGTRPTNVKFWYPGQTYDEGAKDPVVIPENDNKILQSFAKPKTMDAYNESKTEISELAKPIVANAARNALGGDAS